MTVIVKQPHLLRCLLNNLVQLPVTTFSCLTHFASFVVKWITQILFLYCIFLYSLKSFVDWETEIWLDQSVLRSVHAKSETQNNCGNSRTLMLHRFCLYTKFSYFNSKCNPSHFFHFKAK